jgi:hypothetical protein
MMKRTHAKRGTPNFTKKGPGRHHRQGKQAYKQATAERSQFHPEVWAAKQVESARQAEGYKRMFPEQSKAILMGWSGHA